jgi:hypothetical protein
MTVSTSCGFRISRIAREPKLDGWVARAAIFDTLRGTVSSMQVTVIILGEDRYGWEVHCLIRFVPLRVEIELASLFSAVMFFYMFRNVKYTSVDCRRKLVVADWILRIPRRLRFGTVAYYSMCQV